MNKIKFPLLNADDIECRIGQLSKDNTKASLLLYQDARCGMKYLDQEVGAENWQKKFYAVNNLVICSLGIKTDDGWIWKDDTGSAGSIEEEKSIISDSFKRACVCWGIGRELYTAPDVWVKIETKYDKFFVKEIGYNSKNEINKLVIVDKNGVVVYELGAKKQSFENKPGQKIAPNDTRTYQAKVYDYFNRLPAERQEKFLQNIISNEFGVGRIDDLTDEQARQVFVKWCTRG